MKRLLLALLAFVLIACAPSAAPLADGPSVAAGCPPLSAATPTPIVVPFVSLGDGNPCAVALPSPLPPPTVTAGPGLSYASTGVRKITQNTQSFELLGLWPIQGGIVGYRQGDGTLAARSLGMNVPIAFGAGDTIAVAERADGFTAVGVVRSGLIEIRQAPFLGQTFDVTQTLTLATSGIDLALAYGPDGWLYVASGGAVNKYNPFTLSWQGAGGYSGRVNQFTRAANGDLLLLTTAGFWHQPLGGGLGQVWANSVPGDARFALWRNQVLYGWSTGNEWHLTSSQSSGASWAGDDSTVLQLICACAFEVYPAFYQGTPEVIGRVLDDPSVGDGGSDVTDPSKLPQAPDQDFHYLTVARATGSGWYPVVGSRMLESVMDIGSIRPVRRVICVSEGGNTLCVFETRQWSGGYDLEALYR